MTAFVIKKWVADVAVRSLMDSDGDRDSASNPVF